jgi:nucleoid-associated protein EbfC
VNINKIMKQAQKMQETISALEIEGQAGGGAVAAVLNGAKHLVRVRIEPSALEGADAALLEDLVLAAVHDAEKKMEEKIAASFGAGMPGMPGFPGLG